ncbi:MAG TPA: C1 family peptidase [Nocardioides sp.]|jgi:bleomycin hydrolase|uniref:aminopeptidase C n=1 Tax=Nocardioides sp. TaxID=35761 RepID=UPI002E30AFB8|nr:C1 family peptidase [Nocardioides sp.]HEX3931691.1 C1 family peptidase [Nocardioides sp.]
MTSALTPDQLESFAKRVEADPNARMLQNALTGTDVDKVVLDHARALSVPRSMSHLLDDWEATDQKQSGRCWMFAGLNLLRVGTASRLGVKEFEFSQSHLQFWDKLEKANHWLESIIGTADLDVDDRTVAHLMTDPAEDGGQWNMFLALVAKHGLVPKEVMPETHSSSKTGKLNRDLSSLLRRAAGELRRQHADGASAEDLAETKETVLAAVHRMLSLHLGTPPTSFVWQWRDSEKRFHRDGELTPREFAERYVTLPIDDYVCIVHDPRPSSPFGRTFTVEHLGNVVGAPQVVYLNVEMPVIKRLAAEALAGSADRPAEPVWFGCDVDQMLDGDLGMWHASLFDYDELYGAGGAGPALDKAERLHHHGTAMTHAMLLTGVNLVEGPGDTQVPTRWRVENSWGTEKADKGFWTMDDSWFDEYVFEIAVPRGALPEELRTALDQEPIVLPAWDPMGALATG